MVYLDNKTDIQQVWIPRNDSIAVKRNTFDNLKKIEDYLYEIWYDDLDYAKAEAYFSGMAPEGMGDCSALRSGNLVGRNFDWHDNYQVTFAVHTPVREGKYAVFGIAGISALTTEVVESGAYNPAYDVLPFILRDGLNSKGLFMEINVVPRTGCDYTNPSEEVYKKVCALGLIRDVLEHYDSVDSALSYLEGYKIYNPQSLIDQDYEVHFMLADADRTVVLEFIDNELKVVDSEISTNFHLYGTSIEEEVYTPKTAAEGQFASTQGVELYGSGLERYNALKQAEIEDRHDMRNILSDLYYSKAYTLPLNDNFWYSEFVGDSGSVDITVDTPWNDEQVEARAQYFKDLWDRHVKGDGTSWITTHSCVYDLNEKAVWVTVQESDIEHRFEVTDDWQKGYDEGFEDGEEYQKSKLSDTEFVANGNYTNEDGWSGVTVNVPSRYQEGFEDGEASQKSKLTTIRATVNGEYTREDGYSTVNVEVPSRYEEGYREGVADQKAKLINLDITRNGTYSRADGYKAVTVNVGNAEPSKTIYPPYSGSTTVVVTPSTGYNTMNEVKVNLSNYKSDAIADGERIQRGKMGSEWFFQSGHYERYDGWWSIDIYIEDRYEEGKEAQKALLESTGFTSNGTYTRENGWDEVVVNVPTVVDNQSKTVSINSNGTQTVTFDSGYTGLEEVEINTNVPDRYAEGYDDGYEVGFGEGEIAGKSEQKALLESTTITANGHYTKEDGWNDITVEVPTGSTVNNQTKTVSVTSNGSQTITYDAGYTGLESVNLNVNVDVPGAEYTVLQLTQAQYDAIPVKDNNTIYLILCD